jgi:murein L,D-transpeptidase YcbB/YkuD
MFSYLAPRGIHVFQNWDLDAPEVDPTAVDWQDYHANRFPFRLRQDPGPYNALGRIKFMFPNPFAVYLHDTPDRALFKQTQRDFSSGCIRVESPAPLADFVLSGNRSMDTGSPVRSDRKRKPSDHPAEAPVRVTCCT